MWVWNWAAWVSSPLDSLAASVSLTQLQAWCEQQGGNLQNNDFHSLPELSRKATFCFYLFLV